MPYARRGRGTSSTENPGVHGTQKRPSGLVGDFLQTGGHDTPKTQSEIVVTPEERVAHAAAWAANQDVARTEVRTETQAGPYVGK